MNCLCCSSKAKTIRHSDHATWYTERERGTYSTWRRKERKKKICCKAIKHNSSCRGPREERVITMTHWCNPFKTLWLGPRLLPLPPRARAVIPPFRIRYTDCSQLAKTCKLPCRPTCFELPGVHLVLDALHDWQEYAVGR